MKKFPVAFALLLLLQPAYARTEVSGDFAERLTAALRYGTDLETDQNRLPVEVIAFSRIATGMTVADIGAVSGYFTEILSIAVGESGAVFAQNDRFVLDLGNGRVETAFAARLADGRLANVTRWDREFTELGFAADSLDVATIMFVYHDFVAFYPRATRVFILQQLRIAIKPGGYLVVGDHESLTRETQPDLHRLRSDALLDEVLIGGFELVGSTDILRNDADDLTVSIFDPSIRGSTDRYLYLFRAPD